MQHILQDIKRLMMNSIEITLQFILMVVREMLMLGLQLSGTVVRAVFLPIEASIVSAEMRAINKALDIVSMIAESSNVIFCDSLSVVKSLRVHCYHPIIRRLIRRIHDLQITEKNISICWIPSHMGIQGNDC